MRRLLPLLGPIRWRLAMGALLGAATVGSSVALMACSAYIISAAALRPSIAAIAVPVVGVRLFGILRGVLRYTERLVVHEATFRVLANLRVRVLAAAARHVPGLWLTEKRADWLSRIVGDVESLQGLAARTAAPTLSAAVVAVAVSAWVGSITQPGAWVCFGGMACAGLLVPAAVRALGSAPGKRALAARADLSLAALDCVQGLADNLAMGRQELVLRELDARAARLASAQRTSALISAAGAWAAQGAAWAAGGGILRLCAESFAAGRLPGVMQPVAALGALAGFEVALGMPAAWQQLDAGCLAAERVCSLEERDPPSLPHGSGAAPAPFLPVSAHALTVRYGPEGPAALDGVSLELGPGTMTAVVGPSGSGKSTLAWALCGLLPVRGGGVTACGTAQSAIDGDAWRTRVALASQDAHLFDTTAAANIGMRTGADRATVEAAAAAARADAFIRAWPGGYDTMIGERGSRISGGERRRIALARALAREADLTILDESTADLDSVTEAQVLRSVREHRQAGALLVISHRLSAVADADEIVVLSGGRVVQRGRHADLLASAGPYRTMWEAQALS